MQGRVRPAEGAIYTGADFKKKGAVARLWSEADTCRTPHVKSSSVLLQRLTLESLAPDLLLVSFVMETIFLQAFLQNILWQVSPKRRER